MLMMTYFSYSLTMTLILCFVAGAMLSGTTTVGYVFIQEFLPLGNWRYIFGTTYLVIESLMIVLMSLYYVYISKQYKWIATFGFGLEFLSAILTMIYVPESPLWLLKMGRISETQSILKDILSTNGTQ